jgi:hypothetical protein
MFHVKHGQHRRVTTTLSSAEAPREQPASEQTGFDGRRDAERREGRHQRRPVGRRAQEVDPPRARGRAPGGVPEDVRQVAHGANEDRLGRAHAPFAAVLQPPADNPHVLETQLPDRALEEPGLFLAGLEKDHGRRRPSDGEWNSGKPRAAPDVERGRRRSFKEAERTQGVEDVSRVDRGAVAVGDEREGCGGIVDQAPVTLEELERA